MVRPLKPSQIRRLVRRPGIRKHRNSLRYKMRIKQGDTVQVISGDDKGKIGEVLRVFPERNMVLVEGVNIVTYHRKPQREGESGRIETKEAPIQSDGLFQEAGSGQPHRLSNHRRWSQSPRP